MGLCQCQPHMSFLVGVARFGVALVWTCLDPSKSATFLTFFECSCPVPILNGGRGKVSAREDESQRGNESGKDNEFRKGNKSLFRGKCDTEGDVVCFISSVTLPQDLNDGSVMGHHSMPCRYSAVPEYPSKMN